MVLDRLTEVDLRDFKHIPYALHHYSIVLSFNNNNNNNKYNNKLYSYNILQLLNLKNIITIIYK